MAGPNIVCEDRSASRRCAGEIPVRFRYNLNGTAHLGSGRVSDLSPGGLRFRSESPPPSGAEVELRLAWPFHMQITCPPELVIRGAVLRTGSWGTVVRMHYYEFRPCGERPFDQAAAEARACSSIV